MQGHLHAWAAGSSPLARGLLEGGDDVGDGRGIIPARAGFTSRSRPSAASALGSSPLARGLRAGALAHRPPLRIIPARAGFTPSTTAPPSRSRDHPRSRGVYSWASPPTTRAPGSSPLARGLLDLPAGDRVRKWIIPARAGFTPCRRSPWRAPRGSSPLARGLLGRTLEQWTDFRIIPARAGFTSTSESGSRPFRDHPRSRGVYKVSLVRQASLVGSSPLARGLLPPLRARWSDERIIPARAGFTEEQGYRRRHPGDHPRSRGVYRHDAPPVWAWKGSSPLARGLRGGLEARGYREGIIPARAGFTCATPIRR